MSVANKRANHIQTQLEVGTEWSCRDIKRDCLYGRRSGGEWPGRIGLDQEIMR